MEITGSGSFQEDASPPVTSLQPGPQGGSRESTAHVTNVKAHDVPLQPVAGSWELQGQRETLHRSLLRTSVTLCRHRGPLTL